MQLTALPAMADNYIWMLHNGSEAVVCDPGEAEPAIDACSGRVLLWPPYSLPTVMLIMSAG